METGYALGGGGSFLCPVKDKKDDSVESANAC